MVALEPPPPPPPAPVPSAARAFLAWQLAGHWGNRRFLRPAPRAEVLAAVLLSAPPGAGPAGDARTALAAVEAAGRFGRYCGVLLALHLARGAAGELRGELEGRASGWRAELAAHPRYRPFLEVPGLAASLSLLDAWERVAGALVGGSGSPLVVEAPGADGNPLMVGLEPLGESRFRLRPWPLTGPRVSLYCDGGDRPGGGAAHLAFTLMRPSAKS